MSDEIKKDLKVSRRGFLKMGAAAAGSSILSSAFDHNSSAFASSPLPASEVDYEVDSCCQFCQVRCTTKVQVKDSRVVNVYGNPDNYWTGGAMCPKGKSMVELTYSPHRVLYPMVRDGNSWKRISYNQALDMVVERILKIKEEHPEDYAYRLNLIMPLWDSREAELMAKLSLRMAGWPNQFTVGDACIGNTATALNLCLGSGTSPSILSEVVNAETLVLFGANIAEMYPPYMRWINFAREKGVKIVFIDPRRTPTSNFCDMQIQPRPGTDGALVLGVLRLLIKEGLYDKDYVASMVNGFEELVTAVEEYTPEYVSEITWVPAEKVVLLARILAESSRTMVWMGGSISRNTNAINTARGIIALQAITNNLVGDGKGIMNVQGGKPGGEEEFVEHYDPEGLAVSQTFRKGLFYMEKERTDVLLLNASYRRYNDANRVKAAIEKVPFVVYRGFFMDDEAQLADLIIPGTMVWEGSGSQYGAQRQVVWRNRIIDRPGETVEDWRFYMDLGKRLNPDKFPDVNSVEDVFELFNHHVHSWKGITLERLKETPTGITWPCESEDDDKRVGLYHDEKFFTDDGKVSLYIKLAGLISWKEPKGSPIGDSAKDLDKEFPLIFTQGKVVHHWQHTYTNWSSYLSKFSEGNFVQIHPETAKSHGIDDSDIIYIETNLGKGNIGRLEARAKVTKTIMPGVIFTPSHPYAATPHSGNKGTSINTIIPGYWDKTSAQYNGFGCRLVKA
jgi:formate dehydrogenase major subunit